MRFTSVQVMCLHVRTDMNNAAAVCLSVKVVPLHAVKALQETRVVAPFILNLGTSCQLHALPALSPKVLPCGTHGVGSWVGCRAGKDILEKKAAFPGIELRLSVV